MEIKKALTFRASSIGDCLMGKYVLENIHMQFPNARCGIVVGSRGAMIRDLFAEYPWIEVIEVNRRSPRALWSLWRSWQGSDLVITQYAGKEGGAFSLPSKLFARVLARASGLVGFTDAFAYNRFIYSNLVPFEPTAEPAEMERRVLIAAGVRLSVPLPTLSKSREPGTLSRFDLVSGKYVIMHLFSGAKTRGLSLEGKCELVRQVADMLPPEVAIVLTGTSQERDEALQVAEGTRARVIAKKTTLQEVMSLIESSICVVSVDTGVAHMTAQLGKHLVVLTTCLGAHWWGPKQYGESSRVVVYTNRTACGKTHVLVAYPPCINEINISNLLSKLKVIMNDTV